MEEVKGCEQCGHHAGKLTWAREVGGGAGEYCEDCLTALQAQGVPLLVMPAPSEAHLTDEEFWAKHHWSEQYWFGSEAQARAAAKVRRVRREDDARGR